MKNSRVGNEKTDGVLRQGRLEGQASSPNQQADGTTQSSLCSADRLQTHAIFQYIALQRRDQITQAQTPGPGRAAPLHCRANAVRAAVTSYPGISAWYL